MGHSLSSIKEELKEAARVLYKSRKDTGVTGMLYLALLSLLLVVLGIVSVGVERSIEGLNNHGKAVYEHKKLARRGRD